MRLSLRAPDGRELHHWRAVFSEVWPVAAHLPREAAPANDWDATLHGAVLLPGGDVVFNFDAMGMARLDRCGEVVWRLPLMTHHSVTLDERGHFWVPSRRLIGGAEGARFPGLTPPFLEDSILEVSPDGQVLREISLLGAIYDSRYEGVLFANGVAATSLASDDPLHANHVEPLPSALAGAFPLFEAGDVLVSMRNVNLVMVLDGRTARVRWAKNGPWVRQHDPHFLPDGRIAVYDNRRFPSAGPDAAGGPALASRILAIDPRTDRVTVLYEGTLDRPFYADSQGKHQFLPNGNILVTEPRAGRAFEVTAGGEIVWEFVNRYDRDRVANLSQATRYPAAHAGFAGQSCPASAAGPAMARASG
jgi:Arylsulfotransferase (ASST)